ncbi:hypothetical protein CCZ01_04875 [Helicobacter monodelphidis]|uniref:hypothetical protein n=1 Tax=Helicobacter sp. 15-1451 TaxID=2004995 RepID=UPI000DCBC4A1|nr:hypothetical protein [Helicobacter sp. 15-1451]RAX57783.1 hypothetical protein CCZ01_04875 [Helicobacter sp. 15-1451]
MSIKKHGECNSPRPAFGIITPFLAALFCAAAYFYFQFSYSRLVKVDFNEWVLYTSEGLFTPQSDRYVIIFYSSNVQEQLRFVQNLEIIEKDPIIAIDFYQNRELPSQNGRIYATSSANTILNYLLRFKVTQLPTLVSIEREKGVGQQFKQRYPSRMVSNAEMEIQNQKIEKNI